MFRYCGVIAFRIWTAYHVFMLSQGEEFLMNHDIDHALTTIHCTLDGIEAVIQMTMEVKSVNMDAVGYLICFVVSHAGAKYIYHLFLLYDLS